MKFDAIALGNDEMDGRMRTALSKDYQKLGRGNMRALTFGSGKRYVVSRATLEKPEAP